MKRAFGVSLILVLLVSALAGSLLVSSATANPIGMERKPDYEYIDIGSPINRTYDTEREEIMLEFSFTTNVHEFYLSFWYTLDETGEMFSGVPLSTWSLIKVDQKVNYREPRSEPSTFPYTHYVFDCSTILPALSDGQHNVTIYRGSYVYPVPGNPKKSYKPFATVYFNVDATEPKVSISNFENSKDPRSWATVDFQVVDQSLTWVGYSIDGKPKTRVELEPLVQSAFGPLSAWNGNLTLNGLSGGEHYLVIYAKDTSGKLGVSEPITFNITETLLSNTSNSTTLLTTAISITIIASVAIVSFGLVAYFVRRSGSRSK